MNILNIHQKYYAFGGAEKYFMSLEALLKSHGHQVIPFVARDDRNRPSPWQDYFPWGSDFERKSLQDILGFIYSPAASRSLDSLLGHAAVDLAHLHIYYGKLTGSILPVLKKRGIPVIQTLHDYKLVCPVYSLQRHGTDCRDCSGGHFYRGAMHRCNRGSLSRSLLSVAEMYVARLLGSMDSIDRFLCVSHAQKRILCDMGVPAGKMTVLHNFIDVQEFQPEYAVGDYLLYFGRMERVKGIYTLIEAARQAGQTLVMAGDGAELENIRQLEAAAIRDGRLVLTGMLTGQPLKDLVRNAACVVIPSEWGETFGLVAAEAMASGKAVIAANIGGLPEVIEDGVTGYLFEPGSVDDLVAKIRQLLSDPERVSSMGANGRLRVEKHFSPQSHYEKINSIYADVIGSSRNT